MTHIQHGSKAPHILHWSCIDPLRHGSFEDYLFQVAATAQAQGLSLQHCFGSQMSNAVEQRLHEMNVDFRQFVAQTMEQGQGLELALQAFRPDLVHLHFVSPCSPTIRMVQRYGAARLVVSDHASSASPGPAKASRWLAGGRRRRFGRMVDLHLGVSEFTTQRLRVNQAGRRVLSLLNGVDLNRFQPAAAVDVRAIQRGLEFDVDADQFVLGFVGQLTEDKGYDFALELMTLLPAEQFRLVVIGDGPLRQHPLLQQDHVQMLGPRDDVANVMPLFDAMLAPSRWGEAFGLVLAEAAACGVPAIASAVGGIPEVVADGETGALLSDHDPLAWSAAIRDLAEQPEKRLRWGQAARARAVKLFDIRDQVQRTFDLYQELLQSS